MLVILAARAIMLEDALDDRIVRIHSDEVFTPLAAPDVTLCLRFHWISYFNGTRHSASCGESRAPTWQLRGIWLASPVRIVLTPRFARVMPHQVLCSAICAGFYLAAHHRDLATRCGNRPEQFPRARGSRGSTVRTGQVHVRRR